MIRSHVEPKVGIGETASKDARPTPKKSRLRRDEMISLRISKEMAAYLEFIASQQNTSTSGLVRFLVARLIHEYREATGYAYDGAAGVE